MNDTLSSNRKLSVILAADAAGYSRLMAADEAGTITALNEARAVFRRHTENRGGRVVDTAGDSVLAEFPSPIEAVSAAAEIQQELGRWNASKPDERRMAFRVGINLGEIVEDRGAIYGDGVNIAARLQELSAPGGLCISGTVFDQIEGRLPMAFKSIGEQQVRNISKTVRAYRLLPGNSIRSTPSATKTPRRRMLVAIVSLVLTFAVVLPTWHFTRTSPSQITSARDSMPTLPVGAAIAVLPFSNLSGDPSHEYFADGLAEDILTRLSRFSDIRVIGRNSSFKYKGVAVDIRTVGRELGVGYVLEGSVRRTPDTIRVSVQLLETRAGVHLWAESYDLPANAESLFAVQDAITDRVASMLADTTGVIARAKFADTLSKPSTSLSSYECVLRARAYNAGYTAELHLLARTCLEKVVVREPSFAEAWAWLSVVYADQYASKFNSRDSGYDPLEKALQAGEQAVRIEQSNQLAHFALAYTQFFRKEIDKFVTEAETAVHLNPNNATVLAILGTHFVFAGRGEQGKQLIDRAIVLNPFLPPESGHGFANSHYYYHRGEYERAVATIQKVNLPDYVWTHILAAAAHGQLGNSMEARTAMRRLQEVQPGFSQMKFAEEARVWNIPEPEIHHFADGLRKAGLPDE